MARVRDLPLAIRRVGFFSFLKRIWNEVGNDQIFTWAAALSYSWLFAIFPFFLFLLSLVPLLPDNAKIELQQQIGPALEKMLPEDAYQTVWEKFLKDKLGTFLNQPKATFMGLGAILAIWGASGGMAMTMTALDRCYDIDRSRAFVKHRGIAMVLTFVTASLILSIFVLVPLTSLAIGIFLKYAEATGLNVNIAILGVINVARYLIAILLALTALAVVFHFGTAVRTRFRWITPGSLFTLTSWILLSIAFRAYVNGYGKYEQTYGAIGGVVILLLLFYLDALVLLIGAEIDSEVNVIAHDAKPGQTDFRGIPWLHLKEDPAYAEAIAEDTKEIADEQKSKSENQPL